MAAEQFKPVDVDNKIAAPAAPPRTLLTWNIMGRKGSALLNVRVPLIVDEIKKLDCDVVLLQEVTKDIYPTLVKNFEDVYNITPFPGQQLCQVTMSKHKIVDACVLLYNSNKSFVFCRTGGYGVWNVHLNSSRNADAQSIRADQLRLMLDYAKDDKLVLAGDFNLSDKNQQLLFEDYKDMFADIVDVGTENTFNPTANPLAAASDRSGIGRRFDKVWTRGFALAAAAVACVDILVVDSHKLCLSDHYAIRAEFKE